MTLFFFIEEIMKSINFCTTCKGRLWQLRQTLPVNIKLTQKDVSIILLDYHSTDGLEEYITNNYNEYLIDGRLKYYKLHTNIYGFDMAYAKHIVHLLADGDVLFNLDADNYIGDTISELRKLRESNILIPRHIKNTATSRCGRLGYSRVNYLRVGGYDTKIDGIFNDDGNFVRRACRLRLKLQYSNDVSIPIQQTLKEKHKYMTDIDRPDIVVVSNINKAIYIVNTISNIVTKHHGDLNEITKDNS